MPLSEPTLRESALLVIDAQDSFKASPRWERRNTLAFEARVDALLQAYRVAGLPVYFILHSDADAHFEITSPHYKLMDFLAPREGELLLHKVTRNCFTGTPLQRLLTQQGVHRLTITGIQMEQCGLGDARRQRWLWKQGLETVASPGYMPSAEVGRETGFSGSSKDWTEFSHLFGLGHVDHDSGDSERSPDTDGSDRKIVNLLLADGRMTREQIAKEVNLSSPAVFEDAHTCNSCAGLAGMAEVPIPIP